MVGDKEPDFTQPLALHEATVGPDWLDYNGHMTEFRYLQVFGDANDALLKLIGIDLASATLGSSYFTAETHIRHLRETRLGTVLKVETQVIAARGKRLHIFHRLLHGVTGACHATGEHVMIHVMAGKPHDPPQPLAERLDNLAAAQRAIPRPDGLGRFVGQPR